MRILVVEDDFLSRSLLLRFVSEFGQIDVAVDGNEAVEAVKRSYESHDPYGLIFLDIVMPRKDGQAALREIRAYEESMGVVAPDGCKVVMTTAMGDAKNVMGAFASQCEAYVTKPFAKPAIDAVIRRLFPVSDT